MRRIIVIANKLIPSPNIITSIFFPLQSFYRALSCILATCSHILLIQSLLLQLEIYFLFGCALEGGTPACTGSTQPIYIISGNIDVMKFKFLSLSLSPLRHVLHTSSLSLEEGYEAALDTYPSNP